MSAADGATTSSDTSMASADSSSGSGAANTSASCAAQSPAKATAPAPAPATATAANGAARVLAKLKASVAAGNFYEAHQMYRTLYFRYLNQKRYDDCLKLLYTGAAQFLAQQQFATGADLGCLVVDTLEKYSAIEMEQDEVELWCARLADLMQQIGPSVVEREAFLDKAMRWSGTVSHNRRGHPTLHKLVARIMWSESNLEQARHHFLFARDGDGCGRMLVQLSTVCGAANEVDLIVVQAVLQQLCVMQWQAAVDTFATYTKYHPRIARTEPPFAQPLLNFTYFLLDNDTTLPIFRALCAAYKTALDRDPAFAGYLQKIGQLHFNDDQMANRSGAAGGGGLFGEMFSQLFAGFDEDDEEAEEEVEEVSSLAALVAAADGADSDLD